MLVGADQIVAHIESDGRFGNLVNYFKDSVYLHARNLLNALTNQSLTEIGRVPSGIRSEPYGRLKRPLERYVYHLNQARDQTDQRNITADGRHLSDCVHELASEAMRCWSAWIEATRNPDDREKLEDWLARAKREAQDDCNQFTEGTK